MKKKSRVLFISQEITPYLPETEMSIIGRYLPQGIQEKSKEIRTFMPKFGSINERRNQLHEVIRLSGMNLIINDADHPLIIKVASIQSARMQVYFIDNEEYFSRKFELRDENGEYFDDNDERAVFFARGVLETVKKLRWSPDIVHCHGWFTALVPLYLKKAYREDPLFTNSLVVYSVYNDAFNKKLNSSFAKKAMMEGVGKKDLEFVKEPDFETVTQLAMDYSDGIIAGTENLSKDIEKKIKTSNKPYLPYQNTDEYIDAYSEFYDELLEKRAR